MSAPVAGTRATARWIALAAFLVFALFGGGRIAGSDEVTMFELSRAMLRGHIDVPLGATLRGPDGRLYSKNTAGQAVLAMPLVAIAETAARVARFRDEKAVLAARFVASFFNAIVAALLLGVFYTLARRLGVRAGPALAATALLGFTTPFWVYAKSFMAEPLEALGLLMAAGFGALAGAGREHVLPGERRDLVLATLGAFLALSAKLSMLGLVVMALAALGRHRPQRWLVPLAGMALALAGHFVYNAARFGTPFESGYGAQASVGAFSTPWYVGAYGLLLSSGKGLAWFAPAAWLAFAGWSEARRPRAHSDAPRHGVAAKHLATSALLAWIVALFEFGTFQHWAGDGSWGPRYLLPLLPVTFLLVAFALEGATRLRRRVAWVLGCAGLLVTLGGVGVYYGAEMREVGDYPYTLALEDPHFMESSHFDPRFSPIVVHWRMLRDDVGAHLRGEMPRIGQGSDVDPRLGVSGEDQRELQRAIDVWWLYARYAGVPAAPLGLAVLALLAGAIVAAARARRAAAAEAA